MNKKLVLKSAVVVASVVLGVTLGRAFVSRAAQPGPQPQGPQQRFTVVNDQPSLVIRGYEPGKKMISPKPGHFVVDAEAFVVNRGGPAEPVRWRLRIADKTRPGKDVWAFTYANQAFVIPQGATVAPKFHEEVPLPPGRYSAELHLQTGRDAITQDGKVIARNLPVASKVFYQTVE